MFSFEKNARFVLRASRRCRRCADSNVGRHSTARHFRSAWVLCCWRFTPENGRRVHAPVAFLLLRTEPTMFRRLLSAWLVVLVLSPCTAPFSTCDLRVLFGAPSHSGADQLAGRVTAQAFAENLSAPAPVFTRAAGRIRSAAFHTPDAALHRTLPRAAGTVADGAPAPSNQTSSLAIILRI
jgi:hypothetical protein